MALSTYFNWDSTPQTLNAEINMTNFHEPTQELFPYLDETFFLPNTLFEPYFDPTCNFLYPSHDLLSCTSSYEYDLIMSSLSDITPTEDYYNLALPCPKRQKWYHEEQQQQLNHSSSLQDQLTPSNIFDGFVSNNPFSFQADEVPELFSPVLPELFKVPQLPPPCGVGNADDLHQYCEKKTNNEKTTISAQSVAARERRRKITEKTQELGKLVPGGPKMNTAEMLHAATKYVKHLQAQVGMLQLINTLEVTVSSHFLFNT